MKCGTTRLISDRDRLGRIPAHTTRVHCTNARKSLNGLLELIL